MHIDSTCIAGERVTPDSFEKLVAREDEAAMVEKLPEEIELLGRKLYLGAGDPCLPAPVIDVKVTVPDRR